MKGATMQAKEETQQEVLHKKVERLEKKFIELESKTNADTTRDQGKVRTATSVKNKNTKSAAKATKPTKRNTKIQ